MHREQSATDRFFAESEGPNDDALSEAFRWLVKEVEHRQVSGFVVTPAKGNAENLSRVLGADGAAALVRGRSLRVNTQTVTLATMTKRLPELGGKVVLAVWLDDKQMATLDDARPAAICAVPWLAEDITKWRTSWSPVEISQMRPVAPAATIDNPVVLEAMRSLTSTVNLSTGISHPSDRESAIQAFRILLKGKETYDASAVRAWAVQNGWSARGADALQEVAQAVAGGKRLKTRGDQGWRSDILSHWRKKAAGQES